MGVAWLTISKYAATVVVGDRPQMRHALVPLMPISWDAIRPRSTQ